MTTIISTIKELIAIMLFIISIFTVGGKEVDMTKVEIVMVEEITTETETVELDFTNNTKKALDNKIMISCLKKLEGDEWKEITLDQLANEYTQLSSHGVIIIQT